MPERNMAVRIVEREPARAGVVALHERRRVGEPADLTALRAGVPDLVSKVEDFVVEGDRVVARITFSGTNRGGFLGKPPNGGPIHFIAFDIHRIEAGRIVESWHLEDNLTVLMQFGIIPPLG